MERGTADGQVRASEELTERSAALGDNDEPRGRQWAKTGERTDQDRMSWWLRAEEWDGMTI